MGSYERKYHKLPMGEGLTRHVTVFMSPECPAHGCASRMVVSDMLRKLADQPELSDCGGNPFADLEIKHNGVRWVATMSATVVEAS